MLTKKKNVYYCEYCGKHNMSAESIAKHEKHCTLNPNRVCGVCKATGNTQKNIDYLLSMLPSREEYIKIAEFKTPLRIEEYEEFDSEVINKALKRIRIASGNCPACIMATLRQAKIPVPAATDFDYKEEIYNYLNFINEEENV